MKRLLSLEKLKACLVLKVTQSLTLQLTSHLVNRPSLSSKEAGVMIQYNVIYFILILWHMSTIQIKLRKSFLQTSLVPCSFESSKLMPKSNSVRWRSPSKYANELN